VSLAYGVTPGRFGVLQPALPLQGGMTTTVLLGRLPEDMTELWDIVAAATFVPRGRPLWRLPTASGVTASAGGFLHFDTPGRRLARLPQRASGRSLCGVAWLLTGVGELRRRPVPSRRPPAAAPFRRRTRNLVRRHLLRSTDEI
jgi:hypothetical protein